LHRTHRSYRAAVGQQGFDLAAAADHEGRALVDGLGLDVLVASVMPLSSQLKRPLASLISCCCCRMCCWTVVIMIM
jgi:hypothetical protein